jgi:hypothetical protein
LHFAYAHFSQADISVAPASVLELPPEPDAPAVWVPPAPVVWVPPAPEAPVDTAVPVLVVPPSVSEASVAVHPATTTSADAKAHLVIFFMVCLSLTK